MSTHLTLDIPTLATTETMRSARHGDTVTITYRRGYESRRAAAVVARRYAADEGRGRRAGFLTADIGEDANGNTVVTYVYRLIHPHARLRAQLADGAR